MKVEGVDVADAALVLVGEYAVEIEDKLMGLFFFLGLSWVVIGQKLQVWRGAFGSLMDKLGMVLKVVMVDEGERAATSMARPEKPPHKAREETESYPPSGLVLSVYNGRDCQLCIFLSLLYFVFILYSNFCSLSFSGLILGLKHP